MDGLENLNMKIEPFSDEENALLIVKLLKNKKESRTTALRITREAASPEEGLFTIFDFKIKKENCDEVPKETEKLFIKVKHEQPHDSPQDGVISKFSESDDEVVGFSEHDVISFENENEPKHELQQINSGLQLLSGDAVSPEEKAPFSVFDFKVVKEECDEVPKETGKLFIKVKSEQPDDSSGDGVISKFNESGDEVVDCSQHDFMSLEKKKTKRGVSTN
ncbi:uncharacterized protein LOC106469311 isoform X2 [Limulus polyphemus]|uniref:Uncharacterized protein LOC106469311 isoform X2 n=1 Tax=Limulus polyphemus TaxID=6850 RepID=A0ABM1TCA0_LIMPO|nr:uncharacterized protein LOC106469311 isoform X2 [Limulus polyphemus]